MAAEDKRPVRITQQFREAHNMTYELECSGAQLIVRVFPLGGEAPTEWRVEARASRAADAAVASATGPSRAVALERVAESWRDNATTRDAGTFDWNAVAQAMTAVRAL